MLPRSALSPLAALAVLAGCFDAYDPPPEVRLAQPAQGFWTADTPLVLDFSEPIDPATLSVTVYDAADLDREQAIPPGAEPVIDRCTLATAPCGSLEMALDEAGTRLTLTVGETFDGREGIPHLLIIDRGLADMSGRPNTVDLRFDFQISPSSACGGDAIDVPLESGVFTMTANLQVLPIWLHMYLDMAIDPDSGQFLITGTFSRVIKDDRELGPNYDHPDGFDIVLDNEGWAVTMIGCVEARPDGEFFFATEPKDLNILALGVIPVTLSDLKLQGTLKPGAADDGRTVASGTMSASGGEFDTGSGPNQVEALTTAWTGYGVNVDEIPAGMPRTCAEDPCATLTGNGGDCQLTVPWDPNEEVPDGTVCE